MQRQLFVIKALKIKKTDGAVGTGMPIVKGKRTRKPKKEVGGATLGLAAIETEPRGDNDIIPPIIKSAPRASKSKEPDVNETPPTNYKNITQTCEI